LNPVVTLLTDFGLRDEYVGVMKGVILRICPAAQIVDLTHQVAPFQIGQAAVILRSSFRYFTAGTVHLVVVDPGVGTDRALLAAEADGHRFVAPDNGVLSLVLPAGAVRRVVRLDPSRFCRSVCSATFHGRDIMAPAAAHLARGLPLAELGSPMEPNPMPPAGWSPLRWDGKGRLAGSILWIDHFGNLVTNIGLEDMARLQPTGEERLVFTVGSHRIAGLSRTFAQVDAGRVVALIGSRGLLEVAVNRGDARRLLGVAQGDAVHVIKEEKT